MAGTKKFELLFRLTAQLGPNFSKSFKNASQATKALQGNLRGTDQKLKNVSAYQKQQTAIDKSKNKLTKLGEEHTKIAQKIQTHQQNAETLRAKIAETGDATGQLSAQLMQEENEIRRNTEQLRANEAQTQSTISSIERGGQTLEELGNRLREAGVNTDNLGRDTDRLRQQYERLEQAQRRVNEINSKQAKNNASISQAKRQLVGIAGTVTAVGAAIYNGPVKKAADFQEQMSTVSAISGASGSNLQKLSEKAKQMGATTKFTAKEAGEAMEYMAMAGWKTKDMLGGIEGVMNLAAASGEELGTVSDIVTDAMTAFGMAADKTTNGVSNATHFANILAQASSNANTNVGMMGETFKYVAPVAGSLGYSLEDTATMIGVMANSGIKASNAGTALRSIMTRLSTDAGASSKSLGALGILTKKLGVQFYDSKGKTRELAKVIGETRKAWKGLTQEEQNNYAKKIAGQSGISGFLSLMNAEQKDFNKLAKSIKKADDVDGDGTGAAKKMSDTKLNNFNGQITLMKSAWDALQVELGEMLLPTLTEVVKGMTKVTNVVTNFVTKNPETVKTIAKIAAGLVGLKAGSLVAKIGFLQISNGILGIKKAFAIISGIGLGGYLENASRGTHMLAGAFQKLRSGGSGIISYFKNIGSAAKGVGSAAKSIVLSFGNVLKNTAVFTKINGFLGDIAGRAKGKLISTGSQMVELMLKPFSKMGTKLGTMLSGLSRIIINSPLGTIGSVIGKGFSKVTAFIAPVGNAIKTMLGPLGKLATSVFGPLGGIAGKILPIVGVITTIITVIQLVKNHFEDIRKYIKKTFGSEALAVFDKVTAVIANIGNTIKNVFSDGNIGAARNKIQEIFGGKGVKVFDTLVNVFKTVKNAVSDVIQFVVQNVVPVAEQVLQVLTTSIIPGIINFMQAAAPIIKDIITQVITFIGAAIPVIADTIANIMPIVSQIIGFLQTSVLPVIGEIFSFVTGTVLPLISIAIQAILPVVQAVLPSVLAIFQTVFNTIGGIVSGFSQVLSGIIQFIKGVFTGEWRSAWEGIKSIFSGIWEGIKSIATGVINGISSAVNGVVNGIKKVKETAGGIGTKVAKTLHIPGFASGTSKTPNTFIAGEDGPELITNAPGMTVYTAAQTRRIMSVAAHRGQMFSSAAQAYRQEPDTANNVNIAAGGLGSSAHTITINITNSPVINAQSGAVDGIKEQLQRYDSELLEKIRETVASVLREEEDREMRVAYV